MGRLDGKRALISGTGGGIGRATQPEDVAQAILFLASDESSGTPRAGPAC